MPPRKRTDVPNTKKRHAQAILSPPADKGGPDGADGGGRRIRCTHSFRRALRHALYPLLRFQAWAWGLGLGVSVWGRRLGVSGFGVRQVSRPPGGAGGVGRTAGGRPPIGFGDLLGCFRSFCHGSGFVRLFGAVASCGLLPRLSLPVRSGCRRLRAKTSSVRGLGVPASLRVSAGNVLRGRGTATGALFGCRERRHCAGGSAVPGSACSLTSSEGGRTRRVPAAALVRAQAWPGAGLGFRGGASGSGAGSGSGLRLLPLPAQTALQRPSRILRGRNDRHFLLSHRFGARG